MKPPRFLKVGEFVANDLNNHNLSLRQKPYLGLHTEFMVSRPSSAMACIVATRSLSRVSGNRLSSFMDCTQSYWIASMPHHGMDTELLGSRPSRTIVKKSVDSHPSRFQYSLMSHINILLFILVFHLFARVISF